MITDKEIRLECLRMAVTYACANTSAFIRAVAIAEIFSAYVEGGIDAKMPETGTVPDIDVTTAPATPPQTEIKGAMVSPAFRAAAEALRESRPETGPNPKNSLRDGGLLGE